MGDYRNDSLVKQAERLRDVLNELKYIKKVGSQKEFAEMLGRDKSNISQALKGSPKYLTDDLLRRVADKVDFVSFEYLKNGTGGMKSALGEPSATYNTVGSPYYDVDFIGGFDVLTNDVTINPEYMIDLPPYNKDGVIWCNLYGKSMEPYIMSGDKIAIKPVAVEDVIFGKPYGIITNSGLRTVKWVTRSPENNCYRLVPENKDPRFGDYQDIPKTDIYKMFLVMGSIRAL